VGDELQPERKAETLSRWVKHSSVGVQFMLTIVVCTGGGYALDRWLDLEKPWFALGGALLGCAAAMWLIIQTFGKRM
jgi:F0F1-type ATP synthase assembly protein I